MPQLPDGEEDTGQWTWNTGDTTRDITVATDRSFVYRVTYTNARGIKSQLCFPISVAEDSTTNGPASVHAVGSEHGKTLSDGLGGCYDLSGRRLGSSTSDALLGNKKKGVYVMDGRKVIF